MFRADYLKAAPLYTHPTYVCHPVARQIEDAKLLATTELEGRTSYIYRWDTGTQHLSGYGGSLNEEAQQTSIGLWRSRSDDVRPDGALMPADLTLRWRQYLDGIKDQISPEEWQLNQRGTATLNE